MKADQWQLAFCLTGWFLVSVHSIAIVSKQLYQVDVVYLFSQCSFKICQPQKYRASRTDASFKSIFFLSATEESAGTDLSDFDHSASVVIAGRLILGQCCDYLYAVYVVVHFPYIFFLDLLSFLSIKHTECITKFGVEKK